MATKARRVGILLFEGVTALDVTGPADAFASAELPKPPRGSTAGAAYEVVTLGLTRKICRSESGLLMQPAYLAHEAPPLDTLIIPGGSGLREPATLARAAEWIGTRSKGVRRLASVCTGIYALAQSGVLDGRRVTTHWRFARDVAQRFPRLQVLGDRIFAKDGKFYTSGGVTAGIDLSLALIEEDLGASAALNVARELVVYLRRAGGQEQFSEPLRFQASAPDRFSDLLGYVAAHLNADLSVEVLAKRLALSPRQLTRQCTDALGCPPGELVLRMRLEESKERLLQREANVAVVAESVGFRSADAFRRAFEHRFGLNPSAYRARFGPGESGAVP